MGWGWALIEFDWEVEGVGWALIRGWALIIFFAFRMGAYSRLALIRGWALIRINTVNAKLSIPYLTIFVLIFS